MGLFKSWQDTNGSYEDREFVKLNENLIMGHYSFPYYLAHLEELMKKRSQANTQWGLKDPKTSYTLGLFLSVFTNPTIIQCIRDEELIVDSLMRNYGWDEGKARHVHRDRKIRLDNILDNRDHLVIDFTTRKTDEEVICEMNNYFIKVNNFRSYNERLSYSNTR